MAESSWRVRGQYLGHHPVRNRFGEPFPDFYEMNLLTGQSVTRIKFNTRDKGGNVSEIGAQIERLDLQGGEQVVLDIGKPVARVWHKDGGEAKAQLNVTAYGIALVNEPAVPPAANGKRTVPVG